MKLRILCYLLVATAICASFVRARIDTERRAANDIRFYAAVNIRPGDNICWFTTTGYVVYVAAPRYSAVNCRLYGAR